MISIPITGQAYQALKARIPRIDERTPQGGNGKIRIWVDRKFVDRLLELRSSGESYSDVILRLTTKGDDRRRDMPTGHPSSVPLRLLVPMLPGTVPD
jgi:hypothetical protein